MQPPNLPGPTYAGEEGCCYVRLSNLLHLHLRRLTAQFNAGWLACEDALCGLRTRVPGPAREGRACPRPGCSSLLYPEREPSALHMQLEYLVHALDVDGAWGRKCAVYKAAVEGEQAAGGGRGRGRCQPLQGG